LSLIVGCEKEALQANAMTLLPATITIREFRHVRPGSPDWIKENFDGKAEGVDFNALVVPCHEKMAKCGGDIISIENIFDDVRV
jgi:hypothetical protein